MTVLNKTVKDKSAFDFNPITGKLDLVRKFNADRIVTHNLNSAGYPLLTMNMGSGQFIEMDPLVVVDNNGNVVVVGN